MTIAGKEDREAENELKELPDTLENVERKMMIALAWSTMDKYLGKVYIGQQVRYQERWDIINPDTKIPRQALGGKVPTETCLENLDISEIISKFDKKDKAKEKCHT